MLDTVRFNGPWPCRQLPPGQLFWLSDVVTVRTDTAGTRVLWLECSLPRLLFGDNGHVLEHQAHLDSALRRLYSVVADYIDFPALEDLTPSRVDVAWNFDRPARPIILAHAGTSVPRIRSGPTQYPDGYGISWGRGRCSCSVKLYDKCREFRVPGSVLRAEITLRRNRLAEELPGAAWRNWDKVFRAFQRIMRSIRPISAPQRVKNLAAAVAAEPRHVQRRILSRLAGTRSARSIRRYARLFSSSAVPNGTFSWRKELAGDAPPPSVSVLRRQCR